MRKIQISQLLKDQHLLVVISAYCISRLIVYLLGVRLDLRIFFGGGPPNGIDLSLLKTKLFESIFYQHGQPPLFNLFNGIIINVFPNNFGTVFHLFFLSIGLLQFILLFRIFCHIRVARKIALLLTLFFVLAPSAILHENWYNYSHLESFFIILSTWLLLKALQKESTQSFFFFFLSLAVFILIRNMFHLVWFVGIFLGLIILKRKITSKISLAALLPFLLAFSWFLKNYLLFGLFASSSWVGIGTTNITKPKESVALAGQWKSASAYYGYVKPSSAYPNIEILHKELMDDGKASYYHIDYLAISNEFLRIAIKSVKENPHQYLINVLKANSIYFKPVTSNWWLEKNHTKIEYYTIIPDFRLLDICYYKITGKNLYDIPLFTIPIYLITFILSLNLAVRLLKCQNVTQRNIAIAVLFLLFNIFYISTISNLIELGESNRYRYPTIPCVLILIGFILTSYRIKTKSIFSVMRHNSIKSN